MAEKLPGELLQPVRGARDFSGEEKKRRDSVVELLLGKFRLYSFEPLETPAMERLEILSSKFAGGEEILKETFKVSDQGGRELGLRYDLTVPLCRFVASNPRLPFPFKRYAIAPVWRDGPLKTGRYREFYQCDADIVGAQGIAADAEILMLTCDAFGSLFPSNFIIKVSNRKVLDGILEFSGVDRPKWQRTILIIDKLSKIGSEGVKTDLASAGISRDSSEKILKLISQKGGNTEALDGLGKILSSPLAKEGLAELRALFGFLKGTGAENRIQFDPSLARGLNYYTSTVFEAYLLKGKIASSLAAGGRYDDLIGNFSGAVGKIPAVGISFGLDVICEALRDSPIEKDGTAKGVYVFAISKAADTPQNKYALMLASELRAAGNEAYLDLMGRSPAKNLELASKRGFKFAAIVGERELKEGKVQFKNLETGEEKFLSKAELMRLIPGNREVI